MAQIIYSFCIVLKKIETRVSFVIEYQHREPEAGIDINYLQKTSCIWPHPTRISSTLRGSMLSVSWRE